MKLKDYLIASETNNYRPWITTPTALGVFVLVIWGIRLLLPASGLLAAPGIDANDLMTRINSERSNRFIPTLTTNSKLMAAANIKSNDMINRSYFAHVNPDGNYIWPTIEAQGYMPYKTLGENLAMDFTDAGSMVAAWMNSPTHRANVLNENFQDQGMAAIYGLFEEPNHYSILATNLFGTLVQSQAPPPPAPEPEPEPTPTPGPTPAPTPAPTPEPTPEPKPDNNKPPNSTPVNSNSTEPAEPVIFANSLNLTIEQKPGANILRVEVEIHGNPAEVIARVDGFESSLSPIASAAGIYVGDLILPESIDLKKERLVIAATDVAGATIQKQIELQEYVPDTAGPVGTAIDLNTIQTTQPEAELSRTLKIILAVFAGLFLIFLLIDGVIIHRSRIARTGPNSSPHTLVMLLIVAVNLILAFN